MQEVEAGISDLRGICRHCQSTHGDRIRKANAHLESNLARDGKDIKKGFYRFIISRKNLRENVGLLLNVSGDMVVWTKDREKAEVLFAFRESHVLVIHEEV